MPCWAQLSLPRSSAGNIPLLFPSIRSNLVKPLTFRCVCPTRFHMVQSDKPRAFDGRDICYCHLFLCKPYCVVDEILTNQRSCWFYEFNFALPSNSVSHFLESNSKAPKQSSWCIVGGGGTGRVRGDTCHPGAINTKRKGTEIS